MRDRGRFGARDRKPSPEGSVSVGLRRGHGRRRGEVVQCGGCRSEGGWGGWRPVRATRGGLARETKNQAPRARFRWDWDGAAEGGGGGLCGAGEEQVGRAGGPGGQCARRGAVWRAKPKTEPHGLGFGGSSVTALGYRCRHPWGAGERRVEGVWGLQPAIHKEWGGSNYFSISQ